jgi:glycosyltransferase involved in cell wall biosynthesis
MTKLVHIVFALSPGGSELLATRLAVHLARRGRYGTAVYALAHGGALESILAAEGIQSRWVGRRHAVDLRAFVRLTRALRAFRPAVVHTHHLGQLLYGGVAARLAGARVVHTEHEFYTLARPRHQRMLRAFSRLADVVTAVAEPVTEFLHRTVGIPRGKLRTISNGVELDRYETAKPVDRADWGWTREHTVIACIGRLSPEKGQAVLLDAFRRMRVPHPSARLLFVGDGDDRASLSRQAEAWGVAAETRFLGARADVPNILAACDLVVLPSHHEGLPLVAIESMAAGKPVIATAVGALPGLLQNGRYGALVPPGNPASLAESIAALLSDPSRRAQVAAEARRLVEQQYNFDDTVRAYEQVYEQLVSRES